MPRVSPIRKWWIFILASFTVTSWAGEETKAPLRLDLVSEVSTIVPGEPFTVALFLQHAPHHHSYYKFPGIVGVPTSITWELPEGFTAGPLQWPTPEQVDMRGHGAYGYHGDTLLLATITPPVKLAEASSVTLAGKVGYMCCSQEACTPGFEDLSLTLQVGSEVVIDKDWNARINRTRSALPKALDGWQAEVVSEKEDFVLTLRALEASSLPKAEDLYFFSWNGWTASDKPHARTLKDGVYKFAMPKHPFPDEGAKRFQGVVRSESGWPGAPKGIKGLWLDLDLDER